MAREKILLAVSIDTECDKGPGWKIRKPLSFSGIDTGIKKILDPIFIKYGVKATYLLSPEVLQHQNSVAILKDLVDVELGTHLHGEFVEPDADPNAVASKTPQASYGPSIEKEKLANLTDLFVKKIGSRPKSFRAGRWGISKYTVRHLVDLGYEVDSSVAPFMVHAYENGLKLSHYGARTQPYRPSSKRYIRKGNAPIWEIPVTQSILNIERNFSNSQRLLFNSKPRALKWVMGKRGLSAGRLQRFRPGKGEVQGIVNFLKSYVSFHSERKVVVLNMMFHNNEFVPGMSPYSQNEEDLAKVIGDLEELLKFVRNDLKATSCGLSEIPQYME